MRLALVLGLVLVCAALAGGVLAATAQAAPPALVDPDQERALAVAQSLPTPTRVGVITANVPILMYHHVGAPYRNSFNVSLADFEAQMDYLARNGYATVSMDQIAAALRGQGRLPPCPVAITFDDGYADVYQNAVPVLQKHGFQATFYLVTNYISATKTFMNWNQVRDLAAQGMWIGAHSLNHPNLAATTGYTLTRQVAVSKSRLEAALGISITTFAYPYGGYNNWVARVVSDTGYTSAVGVGYAFRQSSERIYKLSRTAVYSDVPLSVFIARLPRRGPDGANACPLPPPAARDLWPARLVELGEKP